MTSVTNFFSHWLYYQHFTMKSSVEIIKTPNTKWSDLLETKLQIIDLFNNTYKNNCQPNWGLIDKGKNTILKKKRTILNKECIFYLCINKRKRS